MGPTVIVTGPQGCGKTRHREAIAKHFRCKAIVDPFDILGKRLKAGALHLSYIPAEMLRREYPHAKIVEYRALSKAALGVR